MSQTMRSLAVLSAIGAIGVGALASGCMTMSMPATNVLGKRIDDAHKPTYNGLALRSGQIVLTESPDATSFVFPLIVKKFYPFTHVAVIAMEGGEPWIYDVTGEVKTLPFRSRLMDNVSGKMYRRRLFEYLSPNLYAEIYDPPEGADGEKMAAFVRQKYKEGVEFDAFFNFNDHSKLFCTELVELAIRDAGGKPMGPDESNPNPSIVQGMVWLGVPPGEAWPGARYADPKRYVASLGQFPTRTAAWSYLEAKREIHRRFTMDQRLGFVVTMDNNGRIDVRPEISGFALRASHLFDAETTPPEPGDPRITAAVRKLAAELFGAFPETAGGAAPKSDGIPSVSQGGAPSAATGLESGGTTRGAMP